MLVTAIDFYYNKLGKVSDELEHKEQVADDVKADQVD